MTLCRSIVPRSRSLRRAASSLPRPDGGRGVAFGREFGGQRRPPGRFLPQNAPRSGFPAPPPGRTAPSRGEILRTSVSGTRSKCEHPVDAPQPVAERLHRRQRTLHRRRAGRALVGGAQEGGAVRQPVQHGAGRFGVLEQELEHRQRLGAHLVDAPVGVARAQQAQERGEFDLGLVAEARTGWSAGPVNALDARQRGVGGDDRAFELLPEPAEPPAVVVHHAGFRQPEELRDGMRGQLPQLARDPGADADRRVLLEPLVGKRRPQAAQRRPRLRAEGVLDGAGVVHGAAQDVDERAGFVLLQHELVTVARRGDGTPAAAFEVRQEPVPHRPVELSFPWR